MIIFCQKYLYSTLQIILYCKYQVVVLPVLADRRGRGNVHLVTRVIASATGEQMLLVPVPKARSTLFMDVKKLQLLSSYISFL
jgi:hypothetical protein